MCVGGVTPCFLTPSLLPTVDVGGSLDVHVWTGYTAPDAGGTLSVTRVLTQAPVILDVPPTNSGSAGGSPFLEAPHGLSFTSTSQYPAASRARTVTRSALRLPGGCQIGLLYSHVAALSDLGAGECHARVATRLCCLLPSPPLPYPPPLLQTLGQPPTFSPLTCLGCHLHLQQK